LCNVQVGCDFAVYVREYFLQFFSLVFEIWVEDL
jgi:hypothetical protein